MISHSFLLIELILGSTAYPILQPLMKLVRDTCEELQSSTFSILFHPIKEQLMTVDSAQMLGNSLRFSC